MTINGIILEEMGDNPQLNREIPIGDYIAQITETDGRSVIKARIRQNPKKTPQEDDADPF